MNSLDLPILFGILLLLIILSAIFSSSETGMMALNKYRLKHHAKSGNKAAIKAQKLLRTPDRLLGVILLGNNFVNIFASSIATIIAMQLLGEAGIALAAGLLTLVVLIFAEVAPKTLAAMYPEKIAYPAAYFLEPLLKLLYPIVWFVNFFANGFLKLFGARLHQEESYALSQEELHTLIDEATGQLPSHYRSMLTSILQLESVTVEDVMIPKQEVYGVNIDQPIEAILKAIQKSPYTRIPLYRGTIDDDLIGILNLRRALPTLMRSNVSLKDLVKLTRPAYYVPETTSLNIQLDKFNKNKRRMALIVDEYGDIQGLLTMEDLLEEIVGKLSTDAKSKEPQAVEMNEDGSWTFDAGEFIRELNKQYQFNLPTDGPKTLNGLLQEELESLPNIGTCIRIDGYVLEVLETSSNAIEKVKLIELT
ncbi:HlyC/CorC family transporter [Thiomicrorhabdus sp. zzn3]|uniref:HlyC/CorC family transporter n=1 Tax=Thiomicrorhabdus sp. zzn3 TaxID=3039775 RepID=UPI002436C57A|nr:HlyC/CorC family transporter [Thiomicrorhabdus sp. zzn3]MDG6777442.1 HlyC/CorC family transporter [Thiomicrorhabdus sp. zzn3]